MMKVIGNCSLIRRGFRLKYIESVWPPLTSSDNLQCSAPDCPPPLPPLPPAHQYTPDRGGLSEI